MKYGLNMKCLPEGQVFDLLIPNWSHCLGRLLEDGVLVEEVCEEEYGEDSLWIIVSLVQATWYSSCCVGSDMTSLPWEAVTSGTMRQKNNKIIHCLFNCFARYFFCGTRSETNIHLEQSAFWHSFLTKPPFTHLTATRKPRQEGKIKTY